MQRMRYNLVSVVIINYNGEDIIKRCIDCILLQTYKSIEIIIIDNNSQDKSLSIIDKYNSLPNLKIIRSKKNLGCPGARNLALNYTRGKYIAFIDNDGFADKNWISSGIKKLESDKNIGAIAPLVLFERNKSIINGIGGFIDSNGYGKDHFYKFPIKEFQNYPKQVLYPMGCGMIIRSKFFENNKFDDILFNYYDDTDIGIKLWCSGYLIATEPESTVYHLQSESDKYNQNKIFLCERNRIYTYLKYIPLNNIIYWFLKEIIIDIVKMTIKRRADYFFIWYWNIKNLRRIIYHRKKFNTNGIFPRLQLNKLKT